MEVAESANLAALALLGLIWLGIITFLYLKRKKSLVYLLFFTIFYIYLSKVLDYTLFQFQSLLLLKYFLPDLMLHGQAEGESINLLPLVTLTVEDLRTSFLNVLLFVPFGFGLSFITDSRFKRVVITGAFVSILIELLQLLTGYLAGITFRVADINDVIFNTIGVAVGYLLFISLGRAFGYLFRRWRVPANPISRYIIERPQLALSKERTHVAQAQSDSSKVH